MTVQSANSQSCLTNHRPGPVAAKRLWDVLQTPLHHASRQLLHITVLQYSAPGAVRLVQSLSA